MRVAVLVGALCALLAPCAPVRASSSRESDALLLSRICVSEAGFASHASGDCGAIHYTLLGTVDERGVSFRSAARAHSPRATGARETNDARLAWVAQLNELGLAPMAWPRAPHAPWGAYRERWLDVLDRSRELVTWTLDDHDEHSMCEAPPTTWAAPWHEPSPGLRAIDCGGTRNRFYTREVAR